MNKLISINGYKLNVKELSSQRVATFDDIDALNQRLAGMAGRNFEKIESGLSKKRTIFISRVTMQCILQRRISSAQTYRKQEK